MTTGRGQAVRPAASDALKVIESVVAPVTALTALMYYFGLLHAYWFLQTFGVEYTVMGFTTYDYLIRSADGLFVPLAATAGLSLLVLWLREPLITKMPPQAREKALRARPHIALTTGILLLTVAITGVLRPSLLYEFVAVPGLALASGVLLLRLAARTYKSRKIPRVGRRRSLHRPLSPGTGRGAPPRTTPFGEWAAIFLLVNVGMFWAVADYSAAVGSQRGADVVDALPQWPDVVIHSTQDLNLSSSAATETVCGDSASSYRFRYDGLKLILQSGEQYLFLPGDWSPGTGSALVVPRTEHLRLDFAPAGTAPDETC